MHTEKFSILEAEAGGPWVQDQPDLYNQTLFEKNG